MSSRVRASGCHQHIIFTTTEYYSLPSIVETPTQGYKKMLTYVQLCCTQFGVRYFGDIMENLKIALDRADQ